MRPLYELVEQHRELTRLADADELDEQTVLNTLAGLSGEIEIKAQSVASVVLNLEAWAHAAKDAEQRIAARRARAENRARWLREYLFGALKAAQVTKPIETPELSIRFKSNPPAVTIAPDAKIPRQFMVKPEPPPLRPDKKALADALKAGKKIKGVSLQSSERLEIK